MTVGHQKRFSNKIKGAPVFCIWENKNIPCFYPKTRLILAEKGPKIKFSLGFEAGFGPN